MSITVRAVNYEFVPSSVMVPSGASVTLTMQNEDAEEEHDLAVRIPAQIKTEACGGPCSRSISFTAPAPGTYPLLCILHPDMVGNLVVH